MITKTNIFSTVPVYQQIENLVQFAIASGKLKAGDQLPVVRELAETLDLNPNTVAKSYRDLEVMGLVRARRGMGVFVNKGVENQCRQRCLTAIIGRMHEVVAEAKAAGFSKKEILGLVDKCKRLDTAPYDDVPASLLKK